MRPTLLLPVITSLSLSLLVSLGPPITGGQLPNYRFHIGRMHRNTQIKASSSSSAAAAAAVGEQFKCTCSVDRGGERSRSHKVKEQEGNENSKLLKKRKKKKREKEKLKEGKRPVAPSDKTRQHYGAYLLCCLHCSAAGGPSLFSPVLSSRHIHLRAKEKRIAEEK